MGGVVLALAAVSRLAAIPESGEDRPRVSIATTVVTEGTASPRVDLATFASYVHGDVARLIGDRFQLVERSTCTVHDRACEREHAKRTGADLIVFTAVSSDGVDHRARFEVVDLGTGEIEATVGDTCELCGQAELEELSRTISGNLVRTLEGVRPDQGTLEVLGNPGRATVRIDGAVVGRTPWKGPIEGGEHEVEVSRPGYVSETHEVSGVRGSSMRLAVDLERDEHGGPPAVAIVGWSLLAGGTATAIGGGVLWSFHGSSHRRSCEQPDAQGDCPQLIQSRPGGIAMVALGTAGAVAGGGLLVWQRVRNGRTRSTLALRPRHDSLGVTWRF